MMRFRPGRCPVARTAAKPAWVRSSSWLVSDGIECGRGERLIWHQCVTTDLRCESETLNISTQHWRSSFFKVSRH